MKKIHIIISLIIVCYFLAPAGVFAAEEDSIEKYATEKTPCALWSEKAAKSMNETMNQKENKTIINSGSQSGSVSSLIPCENECDEKQCASQLGSNYNECLANVRINCDACKKNNEENIQKELKNNPYNGKICTDLMEGIPCAALQEGECRENVNCVQGAIGKRNNKGEISPTSQEEEKMCYAVITGSGLQGIEMYIGIIYRYASWAIGIIAVLMIIISGIQISMGGASQESFAQGKKRIMEVIAGLVLFFLIGVILRTINPLFFQ